MNRLLQLLCVTSLVLLSCTGSKATNKVANKPSDAVGIVGGEYVTYTELKDNYVSGSLNKEYTLEDLQGFLPIYLNYKAKILAARDGGYFENETIESEFQLYAKQAAYAYWVENEIRPTKLNEFKARFEKDVKSAHILIAVDRNALPADTLVAYTNIMEARERFLAGESIEQLDAIYSTKRNGRSMGGDLPWFSVGTTVKEFEDTLYNLEVGEISMPVRTQFGYHLIYLEEVRDRIPSRSVSHIFAPAQAKADADSAYAFLQKGGSWEDAVRQFSKDRPSIPNNGHIGWLNFSSRYDPSFLEFVMNLDPSLEFSEPVQTVYGFHLFKVDSVRTFASPEAKDAFILDLLKNSNTYKENNAFVISYLEEKYNGKSMTENVGKLRSVLAKMDSTFYKNLIVSDSLAGLTAYVFNGNTYSIQNFIDYLKETHTDQLTVSYSANWFNNYKEALLDEQLTALTLTAFPEFAGQVASYKNGLVVYQINEDSVWSAATLDSSFINKRYEQALDQYRFNQRYHYYMITSRADSNLEKATAFVLAGNSPDSLLKNGISVGVNTDSTGAFQGEPFTMLADMEVGTFSKKFEYSNRTAVFFLVDVLPARTMTFNEAYPRVVSDYQPIREEKWLNNLRAMYSIIEFPENLELLYTGSTTE